MALLVELAAVLVDDDEEVTDRPRYYTAETNPFGSERTFLDAGRRGDFPTFKIGRKIAALASDVHTAIEGRAKRRRPAAAPLEASDADLAERAGLRLVGGRR